jgi:formamidopyrimidine-DNA glycosylase
MPELPEVETTRRGIAPHVEGRTVRTVLVLDHRLRQPVARNLAALLCGARVRAVRRRAKYLLFDFAHGTLIVHLGMSGSLRVADGRSARLPHDHVELGFGRRVLRLRDPRRFGLVVWTAEDASTHKLLRDLGPEPFAPEFNGAYLAACARARRGAVKNFLMDAHIVVGVGNIYASEALFRAGIHPARAAGRVSRARYDVLVSQVREVLSEAITAGGTTLRDFVRNDGEPGYFRHDLRVYGRSGEPCTVCGTAIAARVIGQRSSFYCTVCQR